MKRRIYLETSVISYLTARPSKSCQEKTTMKTDEIITEVYAVRDAHAAQCNFDVQAIFDDLQASEAQRIAQGHPYISEPFAVPRFNQALQRTRFVRH